MCIVKYYNNWNLKLHRWHCERTEQGEKREKTASAPYGKILMGRRNHPFYDSAMVKCQEPLLCNCNHILHRGTSLWNTPWCVPVSPSCPNTSFWRTGDIIFQVPCQFGIVTFLWYNSDVSLTSNRHHFYLVVWKILDITETSIWTSSRHHFNLFVWLNFDITETSNSRQIDIIELLSTDSIWIIQKPIWISFRLQSTPKSWHMCVKLKFAFWTRQMTLNRIFNT